MSAEKLIVGKRQGGPAGELIRETTTQGFRQDVLEASRAVPVLVDFWAPWCGPCRQLTPLLEKVVRQSGGNVRLVKLNIDEDPEIPGQLGIQSIPAVIAFRNGQPLDGFLGAVPESEVVAFVARLTGAAGPSRAEEASAAATAARGDKDNAGAGVRNQRAFLEQVLESDPDEIDWDELANSLDSETAGILFDLISESLGRSARTVTKMLEDNQRFREEFAARSREIRETQARTDAKLKELLG